MEFRLDGHIDVTPNDTPKDILDKRMKADADAMDELARMVINSVSREERKSK